LFSQAGSSCGTPQTAAASPGIPTHTRCHIPWQWRHLTATHPTESVSYERELAYNTGTQSCTPALIVSLQPACCAVGSGVHK
jgi:hypothetical protein